MSLLSKTQSQVLTDRALLYNDGGFDVSPDGTKMCACVEYWIEDGVEDVTELIAREIEEVQEEIRRYEPKNLEDENNGGGATKQEGDSYANGDNDNKDGLDTPLDTDTEASTSVSFSSPPRQGTIGSSSSRTPTSRQTSRQGSRDFPSKLSLSDNPKTPPPVAIRPVVPPTPPSPPGRRYPHGTGGGQQEVRPSGASAAGDAGDMPSNPQPAGTSRTVVPMPSLSRRQGPGGGRRRRGAGRGSDGDGSSQGHDRGQSAGGPPPPPPPHRHTSNAGVSFSEGTSTGPEGEVGGRWVPHVVTLSLSTVAPSYSPQSTCLLRHQLTREVPLGNITRACRLAGPKASGVTCVKFSPSAEYCLLGYGVRENTSSGGAGASRYHPVTALYGLNRGQGDDRVDGPSQNSDASQSQLVHVTTMLSSDDDVNIARFHPESGYGFVYGTKQGRVRVLGPRPWNYYYS